MARRGDESSKQAVAQRKSVASAAETGSRLAALAALRDTLAAHIDDCQSKRDLAALSRQFTAVLAQIDALGPTPKPRTIADEIAERRAARRPEVTGAGSRAGRSGGPDAAR